ncbi:electron transport complex subunit RsxB [methane-oxidizing endosymbiont of Gigantopelta aegis]|uniref:electron transport complex subunit RsxB n=1 Tax=methane-oxidizing endosymbiont of Gigantopelta aegis TaxID=2794938 RepID=UPI0018DD401E|nr:electron transport complex subunit RsxB [methane-oxidizing endosymbiont of Gigantopelta aegis]
MNRARVDEIDAILPQTQCTQCGYQGCRPYAEAIAAGLADINQCPPGGKAGIKKLAALLNRPEKPLNPVHGIEKPRQVAVIIEADCIGCTKCLPACPVDAIIGSNKHMHTVIMTECTGCELCIAPCPVDCIEMQTLHDAEPWNENMANHARMRYYNKLQRQQQDAQAKAERLAKQKQRLAKIKSRQKTVTR